MEINQISGTRVVAAVKSPKNDPQILSVFNVENAIGLQHDTFSHNEGKMKGGQDDETTEPESPEASSIETQPSGSNSTVDLFA
jgi:hypothetical protein